MRRGRARARGHRCGADRAEVLLASITPRQRRPAFDIAQAAARLVVADLTRTYDVSGPHELVVDLETARYYAELKLRLLGLGRPTPDSDIWIAASCLQHDLVLVTDDAHLASCPGLKVENWLRQGSST